MTPPYNYPSQGSWATFNNHSSHQVSCVPNTWFQQRPGDPHPPQLPYSCMHEHTSLIPIGLASMTQGQSCTANQQSVLPIRHIHSKIIGTCTQGTNLYAVSSKGPSLPIPHSVYLLKQAVTSIYSCHYESLFLTVLLYLPLHSSAKLNLHVKPSSCFPQSTFHSSSHTGWVWLGRILFAYFTPFATAVCCNRISR